MSAIPHQRNKVDAAFHRKRPPLPDVRTWIRERLEEGWSASRIHGEIVFLAGFPVQAPTVGRWIRVAKKEVAP